MISHLCPDLVFDTPDPGMIFQDQVAGKSFFPFGHGRKPAEPDRDMPAHIPEEEAGADRVEELQDEKAGPDSPVIHKKQIDADQNDQQVSDAACDHVCSFPFEDMI